eukprot:8293_1
MSGVLLAGATLQNAVMLSSQYQSRNGAIISYNPKKVEVNNNGFHIHVQSQNAYDLKLSLDKSWGFKKYINSTITLIIDGYTPFPDEDADFLIVFSVDDLQYFSFFLHLDTKNLKSRIYPSISSEKNIQTVSEWIYNTTTYSQRWDRISNNNQWIILNKWSRQALWPLKFVIEND